MTSHPTIRSVVTEALTRLGEEYSFTYRVRRPRAPGSPISVNLIDTTNPENSCFLHNISSTVVEFCGPSVYDMLRGCVRSWKELKATNINVRNSVLDFYFNLQLDKSGIKYSDAAKTFLIKNAKKLVDKKAAYDIKAIGIALSLMQTKYFDDEAVVNSVLSNVSRYNSVRGMVKVVVTRKQCKIGSYSIPTLLTSPELKSKLAEEIGTTEQVINYLINFVISYGTPNFILKYGEYQERERQALNTSPSESDLVGLADYLCSGDSHFTQ